MATSWLRPLHIKKGKSIAHTLGESTDYAENPEKTEKGNLVVGYACDPRSADEEFLLAKREYEYITGRNQGRRNVIAYHMRQSFKAGEVTPEEAQKIGYELAMRFTKGSYAFIVAVHTDRAHIHSHIIFNSTSLDCTRKFDNFWGSSFAVRRLSDIICAEHGLSVIENPKPSKGKNYGKWLGGKKEPTHQETLKQKIDEIVPSCQTFEDFINKLKADDFIVSKRGRNISVQAPEWGKPVRLNTLKGDYTEAAIRARLGTVKIRSGGSDSGTKTRVNLLVDIQAKLREGKGAGYAQWAKIFNLKETAKMLIFLKENGIDSYEELKKKASSASGDFAALTKKICDIETRQKEITELQKQIRTYGNTRDIYAKYKKSGWNRDFYDAHAADIILHRAAKKYFNDLGMKKLPSINQLKQEYSELATEKKKLYGGYHELKDLSRQLTTACANAESVLGITAESQERSISRAEHQH